MNRLFFDTETTGKYNFNAGHEDPSQPHLVQLGAVLHDADRKLKASINVIIKPDGWTIPEEAAAVHGITTEVANKFGIPLATAIELFTNLLAIADTTIAHNIDFDRRIIRTAYLRLGQPYTLEEKPMFCTMKESTNVCKIPSPRGYKWPNLAQAHQHFTGEGFDNAHDAMADVLACSRVYYHLLDLAIPF